METVSSLLQCRHSVDKAFEVRGIIAAVGSDLPKFMLLGRINDHIQSAQARSSMDCYC